MHCVNNWKYTQTYFTDVNCAGGGIFVTILSNTNPPFTKELGHPQFLYHKYWQVIIRIYAT